MHKDLATEVIIRERIESKLRYAEQARLARAVGGPTRLEEWLSDGTAVLDGLWTRFSTTFRQQVVCKMNPTALGC